MSANASQNTLYDLEHAKSRLDFYTAQKARAPKNKALDKWLEIYGERVQKLQRQASKLGLRTQLDGAKAPRAAALN